MEPAGTDAVGVLRWGLRRYWVVFAACLVVGAVVAPLAFLDRTTPAEAQALVLTQRLDMDLTALPRYAETVFGNGQVEQAVSARFGDLVDGQAIIPDRVSVVAEQDSIMFTVIGRDHDPQTAADLANTAADAFVQALNAPGAGVGAFAVQTPARAPAPTSSERSPVLVVSAGAVAGAVLGLALVTALLVL